MTAFPTPSTPPPETPKPAPVDGLIQTNRARTPSAAIEKRQRPRLSIAELNDMDAEEIRHNFLDTGPLDDRTPVQKVLDIVDLPRNTNANLLFGKPTVSGVAESVGAGGLVGGALGAIIGGIGGTIAEPGGGTVAGALAGAKLGAATGAALTGASHALAGAAGLAVSRESREAITQGKEVGGADQPRIFTSDALRQMGVNNRVANALLGFAGDVAMDPLTYAGGEGFGVQAGNKTLRAGVGQALKQANKARTVAEIADPYIKDVLIKAGKYAPDAALKPGEAGAAILGSTKKGLRNKAFTLLGEPKEYAGGLLEKYTTLGKTAENAAEHEAIDAAQKLYTVYGQGTQPGLKLGMKPGEVGSQVFHLPFGGLGPMPSWVVQVPAFTATGRKTLRQFEIARQVMSGPLAEQSPHLLEVQNRLNNAQELSHNFAAANDQYLTESAKLRDAIEAAPGGRDAAMETQLRDLTDQHRATVEEYRLATLEQHEGIRQAHEAFLNDPTALSRMDGNGNTLLYLAEQDRMARELAGQADTHLAGWQKAADLAHKVKAQQADRIGRAGETLNRLVAMDAQEMNRAGSVRPTGLPINIGDYVDVRPESGMASFGPDGVKVSDITRDQMGTLHAVLDAGPGAIPHEVPLDHLDVVQPRPRTQVGNILLSMEDQAKANSLKSQIEALKQKAMSSVSTDTELSRWWEKLSEDERIKLDDLQSQLDRIEAPYYDKGGIPLSGVNSAVGTFRGRGNLVVNGAGKVVIAADPAVQDAVFESVRPIIDELDRASNELAGLQKGANYGEAGTAMKGQQPLFGEVQGPAELARINDLTEHVANLRKQLYEATAPLRDVNGQTIEEFSDALKQRVVDQLDKSQRALWDLHGADPSGAEALVDAFQKRIDNANRYRAMVQGNIAAHLSTQDRAMLQIVKGVLGTADDQVAASTIGQLATALSGAVNSNPNAAARFMQAVDRRYGALFGTRYGLYGREMAYLRSMQNGTNAKAMRWIIANVENPLRAAVQKAGLSNHVEDALALLTLKFENAYNAGHTAESAPIALKVVNDAGDLVDSELVPRINALMAKLRAAGPQTADDFFKELDQIVANQQTAMRSMTDKEMAARVLDHTVPSYTPHIPTTEAQKHVLGPKKGMLDFGGTSRRGPATTERFQIPRTTTAYIFPDIRPDRAGKWEMFTDMDRYVQDPAFMAHLKATGKPEDYAAALELKDKIERYERMVNKPAPKQLDIATLNRMNREQKFGPLSMPGQGNFFEDRWSVLMARRLAMHERAMMMQDATKLANDLSIPLGDSTIDKIVGWANKGVRTRLKGNGETGEEVAFGMVRGKWGGPDVPVMYARGRTYRMLSQEMKARLENDPIASMFKPFDNKMLPEEVANFIEDLSHNWSEEKLVKILHSADWATSLFKSMTLLHPSWFINNLIGHVSMLITGDVDPATWAKMLPTAIQIRRYQNNPEMLAKIVGKIRGEDLDAAHIMEMAHQHNTFGSPFFQEPLEAMMGDPERMLPSHLVKRGASFTRDGLRTDYEYQLAGRTGRLASAGAAWNIGKDRFSRSVTQPFFQANGFVQDAARLAGAMALMEKGADAPSAFDTIRRIMYDHHDFTGFEQNVMKRLVPFYTWAKSNLSYQVRLLFQHPQYMNLFPKLQNSLEEALDGEQRVPMSSRPEWMRQMLAIQMGQTGYMPLTSIPTLEALQLLQGATGMKGVQEAAKYGVGYANPALTFLPQLAAGRETFSGRSIGDAETGGDMTTGQFIAKQIRPLAEFGPGGNVGRAFDQGGVVRAAQRVVAGGRLQPMDPDTIARQSGRDLRADIENARKAFSIAQSRGDQKQSLRMRVRMLKLYQKALENGLDSEVNVPRWARETLSTFANTNNGG